MRYISKPVEVDAIHYTRDTLPECRAFAPGKVRFRLNLEILAGVNGVQGWVDVPEGHWIVSQPDDRSDIWPVENAYFQTKYYKACMPISCPPPVSEVVSSVMNYQFPQGFCTCKNGIGCTNVDLEDW